MSTRMEGTLCVESCPRLRHRHSVAGRCRSRPNHGVVPIATSRHLWSEAVNNDDVRSSFCCVLLLSVSPSLSSADLPTFYEIKAEDLPRFGEKTRKIFMFGKK